jgi:hypothetical protein
MSKEFRSISTKAYVPLVGLLVVIIGLTIIIGVRGTSKV